MAAEADSFAIRKNARSLPAAAAARISVHVQRILAENSLAALNRRT